MDIILRFPDVDKIDQDIISASGSLISSDSLVITSARLKEQGKLFVYSFNIASWLELSQYPFSVFLTNEKRTFTMCVSGAITCVDCSVNNNFNGNWPINIG
jgi:hypothetical protein